MKALEKQLAVLRAQCGSVRRSGECAILRELAAARGESCAHAGRASRKPAPDGVPRPGG